MESFLPSRPTPDSPSSERSPLEHRIEGLDGHHAAAPQLGFMLAGAQWRDSWLHGFRSLCLVMEVILLGLAGGLLVSILTLEVSRAWVPAMLLLVDATGSLLLLARMRRAAIGLGDDVRFWHREIVRAERELPRSGACSHASSCCSGHATTPTLTSSPPWRFPKSGWTKQAWTG